MPSESDADQSLSRASPRSFLREWPGLASLAITRDAWFCPLATLMIMAALLLVIAGTLYVVRQGSPPSTTELDLISWGQACVLGSDRDNRLQDKVNGDVSHPGPTSGLGRFCADDELDPAQAITLADLFLAVGQPQWACLDYGMLHGEPVFWVRLVFDQGQIEAFAPLSVSTLRLSPETAIHVLYCYASAADYPVWQVGTWHGLAPVASYQECRHAGTATPR